MARLPRLAVAGCVHHVLQRGHSHRAVFVDDADRQAYLDALREVGATLKVAIHAYALLEDAVQLVVTPEQAADLGRLMQSLGRRYVAGFNRRHAGAGTLWEGRFRASVVEGGATTLSVLRCVEQSPVRAGLSAGPLTWAWSSASHHVGALRDRGLTDPPAYWALGNTPFEREIAWRRLLEEPLSADAVSAIEGAALRGAALGSGSFLAKVYQSSGRPLVPRPRGRPPGATAPKVTA